MRNPQIIDQVAGLGAAHEELAIGAGHLQRIPHLQLAVDEAGSLAAAARGGESAGDRGRIVRRRRLPMYAVFVAQERSPSGVVALPIDSVCRRCIW